MTKGCIVFAVLMLITVVPSFANPVASRAALDALLGGSAVTEDYEAFAVSPGDQAGVSANPLNNASSGGLIVPGLSFEPLGTVEYGSPIYVAASGYFSIASDALLAGAPGISINFTNFTQAFGMDVFQYAGYASRGYINIWQGATLLGNAVLSFPDAPSFTFVGWEDAGGITRVDLVDSSWSWSPINDNLTFGTYVVPEPATLLLLGTGLGIIGLAAWRKRK